MKPFITRICAHIFICFAAALRHDHQFRGAGGEHRRKSYRYPRFATHHRHGHVYRRRVARRRNWTAVTMSLASINGSGAATFSLSGNALTAVDIHLRGCQRLEFLYRQRELCHDDVHSRASIAVTSRGRHNPSGRGRL